MQTVGDTAQSGHEEGESTSISEMAIGAKFDASNQQNASKWPKVYLG